MRPASIKRFELLYLAAILLGLVGSWLEWDRTIDRLLSNPETAAFGTMPAAVMIVVGAAVSFTLLFFVARGRSTIAKWILTVLTAIGVLGILAGFATGGVLPDLPGLVRVVAITLQVAAVAMLFRADAVAWFRGPASVADAQ